MLRKDPEEESAVNLGLGLEFAMELVDFKTGEEEWTAFFPSQSLNTHFFGFYKRKKKSKGKKEKGILNEANICILWLIFILPLD